MQFTGGFFSPASQTEPSALLPSFPWKLGLCNMMNKTASAVVVCEIFLARPSCKQILDRDSLQSWKPFRGRKKKKVCLLPRRPTTSVFEGCFPEAIPAVKPSTRPAGPTFSHVLRTTKVNNQAKLVQSTKGTQPTCVPRGERQSKELHNKILPHMPGRNAKGKSRSREIVGPYNFHGQNLSCPLHAHSILLMEGKLGGRGLLRGQ